MNCNGRHGYHVDIFNLANNANWLIMLTRHVITMFKRQAELKTNSYAINPMINPTHTETS